MFCALSVIVFTAHFKYVEQKVGFSVAFVVLNGLQERFVLGETSTCVVIGAGGKYERKDVCTVLFERWMGRHR